jgi:hypothetical protein
LGGDFLRNTSTCQREGECSPQALVPGVPWGERVINANPGFYICATLFALLGVALQTYRVVASKRRTIAAMSAPFPQSWAELQTNVQLKAVILVLTLGATSGGLSYAVSP